MNPADFHSERFYCKLRSVAHPCMVMKVGMHEYQGTWRMKLLAPYPAHSAPNRVPSIEVAMYTRDGSRCLIAMRVHSVPMNQLPLLLATEQECRAALGDFIWDFAGAPLHNELQRQLYHWPETELVIDGIEMPAAFLSADSGESSGGGVFTVTEAQERAAREALQQQLRQDAPPIAPAGLQQQIRDEMKEMTAKMATIRDDVTELQHNVRPAGRGGVRLSSGSEDLQLSEEDLARLRELVPPGARAMVPEGLRAKSGGGIAASATRASHLRETLGAVGSNRAGQEPTLAKAALRLTEAVEDLGDIRGSVGAEQVGGAFARGFEAKTDLRKKFEQAPLEKYKFVMHQAEEALKSEDLSALSDAQLMRRYFERVVPIKNYPTDLQMLALLHEMHRKATAKDLDAVLGLLAAGFQFLESKTLHNGKTELAWAATHLPPVRASDYTAQKDSRLVGAPYPIVAWLTEPEIMRGHSALLKSMADMKKLEELAGKEK